MFRDIIESNINVLDKNKKIVTANDVILLYIVNNI
jgi:hypothetical protein